MGYSGVDEKLHVVLVAKVGVVVERKRVRLLSVDVIIGTIYPAGPVEESKAEKRTE